MFNDRFTMKNSIINNLLIALGICIIQNLYGIDFTVTENGREVAEYDSNSKEWIRFGDPKKKDSIENAIPPIVDHILTEQGDLDLFANQFDYPPNTLAIPFNSLDINDDWTFFFSGSITVFGNEGIGNGETKIYIIIFIQDDDDDYTFILQGTYINNPNQAQIGENECCIFQADSTTN